MKNGCERNRILKYYLLFINEYIFYFVLEYLKIREYFYSFEFFLEYLLLRY